MGIKEASRRRCAAIIGTISNTFLTHCCGRRAAATAMMRERLCRGDTPLITRLFLLCEASAKVDMLPETRMQRRPLTLTSPPAARRRRQSRIARIVRGHCDGGDEVF